MQSKNSPRISICIPNYNRSTNLLRLLRDIEKQTVKPYEVIVQDDRSTKEEIKIIKKNCPRKYKLILNKRNLGLMENIISLVKKAKGEYMAIVHNDDRLSKYYIEEFTKTLNKY